jgi:hypothetical protein
MRKSPVFSGITDYALIAVFAAAVGLPPAASLLGGGTPEMLGEKRLLAEPPVPGRDPLRVIPEKFEAYYRDHFRFRNELIRGHNWIRYKLFKGQSFGKVFFGEDDWLFLTKSGIFADYLGLGLLDQERLAAWTDMLGARRRMLEDRSIFYLLVIAPNKAVIYPEKLPEHICSRGGKTRMDQLVEHIGRTGAAEVLDVREALIQAKDQGLLYFPQDTHWNDRGALVVYRQIFKSLGSRFDNVRPWSIKDFRIVTARRESDLATMLGLGKQLEMDYEKLVPLRPRRAVFRNERQPADYDWPTGKPLGELTIAENPAASGKALVFIDSFGARGQFRELLAEHFARTVFVSASPSNETLRAMAGAEKPDVVIDEVVERKLKDPPEEIFSAE